MLNVELTPDELFESGQDDVEIGVIVIRDSYETNVGHTNDEDTEGKKIFFYFQKICFFIDIVTPFCTKVCELE